MINFLLDVDGVLADFVGAMIRDHDMRIPARQYGAWDYHRRLGMTDEAFWAVTRMPDWWLSLECYPKARAMVSALENHGRVIYCTSPSRDPDCARQKIAWLRRYGFLSIDGCGFMIGPEKSLMARPGNILIDDSDANIDVFRAAGGEAWLFPRPWNRGAGVDTCPYGLVEYLARLRADNVGNF